MALNESLTACTRVLFLIVVSTLTVFGCSKAPDGDDVLQMIPAECADWDILGVVDMNRIPKPYRHKHELSTTWEFVVCTAAAFSQSDLLSDIGWESVTEGNVAFAADYDSAQGTYRWIVVLGRIGNRTRVLQLAKKRGLNVTQSGAYHMLSDKAGSRLIAITDQSRLIAGTPSYVRDTLKTLDGKTQGLDVESERIRLLNDLAPSPVRVSLQNITVPETYLGDGILAGAAPHLRAIKSIKILPDPYEDESTFRTWQAIILFQSDDEAKKAQEFFGKLVRWMDKNVRPVGLLSPEDKAKGRLPDHPTPSGIGFADMMDSWAVRDRLHIRALAWVVIPPLMRHIQEREEQ